MTILGVVGAAIGVVLFLALAVVLLQFNLKKRFIARCAASATPEQLEEIYKCIEEIGSVAPRGYLLARTNKTSTEPRCLIPLPMEICDFPWAGKVIEVTAAKSVEFRFIESIEAEPMLLGRVYRPVKVPRQKTKTVQKERNIFAPDRYLSASSGLCKHLELVCSKYPAELLSYLICVGRDSFEFEPIDQARIGTSPAWVQDSEYQYCPECKRRMVLVAQLPGTVVSLSAFHRGTFYLFGCTSHPDQITTLEQFT